MNVFAKFGEILSMILQDIKETKRYGHKNVSDTRSDSVKTVYPPTNTVCGGYNKIGHGQPRVIIYIKFVELEALSSKCYMPSFKIIGLLVLEKILRGPGTNYVNISHESKSERNSEAVIWQWMYLIG